MNSTSRILILHLLSLAMVSAIASDNLSAMQNNNLQTPSNDTSDPVCTDSIYRSRTDSVSVTQLQELVVKSESRWYDGNKLICIPTKKERNLSNSPSTLIERMMIPGLRVIDGSVSNANGQPVQYFINGVRAEGTDLAVFRTKDVLRVEYITNPDDPKFEGASAVVNFIMQEYEVGGVTKLNGWQIIPNMGKYNAASKLNYKAMTYAVMFNSFYRTNRQSKPTTGVEEYKDLWHDGVFYPSISRDFVQNDANKTQDYNIGANIRYLSKKVLVSHNVALKWSRNPENNIYYGETWAPNLFDAFSSNSIGSSRSFTPEVTGKYMYQPNDKLTLLLAPGYSYTRNSRHFSFATGDKKPTRNDITEDAHSARWQAQATFQPDRKWMFMFDFSGNDNIYNVAYSGTSSQHQKLNIFNSSVSIMAAWRPKDNFDVYLNPGIGIYRSSQKGHDAVTTITPSYDLNISWTPANKLSFGLFHYMRSYNPAVSHITDTRIQTSNLMWLEGNPNLKDYQLISSNLNVTWIASEHYSITGTLLHNFMNRWIVHNYAPASPEDGGLVDFSSNGASTNVVNISANLNISLLNRKLYIQLMPVYAYENANGIYKNHLHDFWGNVSAGYTVGNCQFSVSYRSPTKNLRESGAGFMKRSDSLSFGFMYGIEDFYISVSGDNLLNKYQHTEREYTSPYYTKRWDEYVRGRSVSISMSYVFGYGKKVSKNIEVNTVSGTDSAVVGSAQ